MKEGAEKMARYGKWAERNNLKAEICKFNLHTAACQFYFQERDMCPPGLYKEMWVELGMQLAKSGAPTAGGDKPEPTIARYLAVKSLRDEILRDHPRLATSKDEIFGKKERNKNPNIGVAEELEGMLLSGNHPTAFECENEFYPALSRFATSKKELLPPGWRPEWISDANTVQGAVSTLSAMKYTKAVIHGFQHIASTDHTRERNRLSCFVQIRYSSGSRSDDEDDAGTPFSSGESVLFPRFPHRFRGEVKVLDLSRTPPRRPRKPLWNAAD